MYPDYSVGFLQENLIRKLAENILVMLMEKVKKYKKRDLRMALEKGMQEYWNDPMRNVTPMEFSRMLKAYCEEFDLPDSIRRAKELDESFVDAFGVWLGYPLR